MGHHENSLTTKPVRSSLWLNTTIFKHGQHCPACSCRHLCQCAADTAEECTGACKPSTCTALYFHFMWQKMGERERKHIITAVCQASFSFFAPDSKQCMLLTPTSPPV